MLLMPLAAGFESVPRSQEYFGLTMSWLGHFIFGINHPPTINDSMKLPRHAKIIGYCALIIFVISFIPVPFKMM